MKNLNTLNRFRIPHPMFVVDEHSGAFVIPNKQDEPLGVIASIEDGQWDHVSVSLPDRCPSWDDMRFIKDLFFEDEEEAYQFHPKKSEYVNSHPFCLHLWRRRDGQIDRPPF